MIYRHFKTYFILIIYLVNLGSAELDNCNQCKVLSDSFNNWLQKTAQGKFEGDTALEEAKLKSYSRSEKRLVEIQEGLCSEVKRDKDQCYAFAEEAEHLLKQWWLHEDPNSQDLFTWLCTSTLQYCCPKNHFGPLCKACPVDKNDKICGEHGVCDGEGTRKGNGSCICDREFAGDFCENCADNYYRTPENCKPCHKSCDNCKGQGAAACIKCRPGWRLKSRVCKDVNECLRENACKANEYCVNLKGSYSCEACHRSCKTCSGEGRKNCTSCTIGSVYDGLCFHPSGLVSEQITFSFLRMIAFITIFYIHQKTNSKIPIGVIYVIFCYVYYKYDIAPFITVMDDMWDRYNCSNISEGNCTYL